MNTHKITWASRLASVVAAVGITLAPAVRAQINLGQLFSEAINSATQQQAAPEPSASGQLPNGFRPNEAPPEPVDPGLWASKADFLAATRNGDMTGIPNIYGVDEFAPVLRSITQILRAEYGVPPLPRDRLGTIPMCQFAYQDTVQRFMGMVTATQVAALGKRPFSPPPSVREMEDMVEQVSHSDNGCDMKVLGQLKPHPYKAALINLMDKYGQATKVYVDAELGRRREADAKKQAQIQAEQKARADAQAKQDIDDRAMEQQRIDEERARIQSAQKKRQEQDKKRVGG